MGKVRIVGRVDVDDEVQQVETSEWCETHHAVLQIRFDMEDLGAPWRAWDDEGGLERHGLAVWERHVSC